MCHGHEDTTCFLPCFDSGGMFLLAQIGLVHLFCLGGTWDLSRKYPLLFCFVAPFCACISPFAGWRVGRSIGATAVRRSPGRIEVCDESDRIDLSEQPYCLST